MNKIPDRIKYFTVGRQDLSPYKKTIMVNVQEIRENKYDLSIFRYKPIEYEFHGMDCSEHYGEKTTENSLF